MTKNRLTACVIVPAMIGMGFAALITMPPGISRAATASATQPSTQPSTENQNVPATLNFKMKSLEGKDVDLAKYKGKVVMMVNVASKCGNTPQYKELESLHEKYKDRGLAILGFPADNFGHQEPGTDSDIKTFCEKNYGVKFDMFSKISVKGDDQAPLYKYLTENAKPNAKGKDVAWNFEKFLIGRDGRIAARFENGVKPDAPEVVKAVEAELAKTP